ncbi:ThiF family adenylyltransferase [Alkalibacterium olivapovliticus]|uniref:ThiF family protein n=1 Tax=Alkalibacterium olivapovliticus TaxID=99907 RepID=A0A2T0W807_9LACT|nr:ThiF family adenylyltransferase [Alkalibacterium olivapovliticus]PRY82857.1 ThiF family protein [Alkalibacterium olivapovliticus]
MINEQFSRNLGIMSEEEVQTLHDATIAIAGCGCIGGFSAELLTRMGVGKLVLADPDTFDVSNINRQCAATHLTVGQRKAEVLKNHLLTINPDMEVVCYNEGVSEENAPAFVEGADYVIDAIDYFAFPEAVALHRAARLKNLFITTAVALGFGTSVMTFSPRGLKLEEYVGIPEDISIDNLRGQTFPPALYTQNLPDYATEEKIAGWLKNRSIPTISVGQALGPGVLVSKLVLHLLDRKEPKIVPDYFQLQLE